MAYAPSFACSQQVNLRSLSSAQLEALRSESSSFARLLSSNCEALSKLGILRRVSSDGSENVVKIHQYLFCRRVFDRLGKAEVELPRWRHKNEVVFMVHKQGLGKTVTALVFIAALFTLGPRASPAECGPIDDIANASPGAFLNLIVAPKHMLMRWVREAQNWLSLGDKVVLVEKQDRLTQEVLDAAHVIILSADTLVGALKSFARWERNARVVTTASGGERRVGAYVCKLDASKRPIAPHPLYAWMQDHSFASVIVDEVVEKATNPKTYWHRVISDVSRRAIYKLGLAAILGKNNPSEMAGLCSALNTDDPRLHSKVAWLNHVSDTRMTTLAKSTVDAFHARYVDLVQDAEEPLPDKHDLELRFHPFVGKIENGGHSSAVLERHAELVDGAKAAVNRLMKRQETTSSSMGIIMKAVMTAEQLCFSDLLGLHGTETFRADNLFKLASKRPSQQVQLAYRVIRQRQKEGKEKIVVFAQHVAALAILRDYLAKKRDAGRLFMFTGEISSSGARQRMIDAFQAHPRRAVFLMSSSGVTGITLDSASVILTVGSLPWSPLDLEQLEARIRRIDSKHEVPVLLEDGTLGTKRAGVECIRLIPIGSPSDGKKALHEDKLLRLQAALTSDDFSNFAEEGTAVERAGWRRFASILSKLGHVSSRGVYVDALAGEEARDAYISELQAADAKVAHAAASGVPVDADLYDVPIPEDVLKMEEPTLAKDLHIPPSPYAIEGFVETPLESEASLRTIELPSVMDDESSSESESESDEERARAKRPCRSWLADLFE